MKYDIPNDKPEMFDHYINDIETSIDSLLDPNAAKTGAALPCPLGRMHKPDTQKGTRNYDS